MYRRLFPDKDLLLTWQVYVMHNDRCPFDEFLDDLQKPERIKLIARMEAFASAGWNGKAGYVKQVVTSGSHTVYEIKSHQQRVLFIRCGDDPVAVTGFTKKTDWGKKEKTTLAAAEELISQAASDCGGRR